MSQLGLGMQYDEPDTRRRRASGPLAVLVALLLLAAIGFGAFLGIKSLTGGGTTDFQGEGSGSVTIVVKKGDSLTAIGRTLAGAEVVASSEAFVDAASADERAQSIAPGAYRLRTGMSGAAALELMLNPDSRVVQKVVVPEGLRFEKTIARITKGTDLSADAVKEALSRAGSLGLPDYAEGNVEGFLFPATYEFEPGVDADTVVKAMLTRFRVAAKEVDLVAEAKKKGLTPFEVVVMASLVQGESAPEDYDKVARVIYNRLEQGMPLQLDSTVNYALGKSDLQLSAEELKTDSPYNTYVNKGLPPGPINSPGEAAMTAVLNPAKGDWLYFVTTDPENKTTEFATTYDEFLALKRKFQANVG